MDSLRRLKDLLAELDVEQTHPAKRDHSLFYRIIKEEILSPKSPFIKRVPPIEFVIYAIKNIVAAPLSSSRIPDLLHLLTIAEFYRGRTLDYARNASTWNGYYTKDNEQNENALVCLSATEAAFLKKLENKNTAFRKVYIAILCTCCQLDMHLLWTASPLSITDFLVRFNEYFPSLNEYRNIESNPIFRYGLSEEESAKLQDIGLTCCEFVQDSVEWAMENKGDGQRLHDVFQGEQFQETFRRPCQDAQIYSLIKFFLDHVALAAKGVNEMFIQNED
ncbi:hypothetical protein Hypma_007937 [Hypsizygus marmoreus]|uniref:Uncharacterized protein n=1 Tax=Hypsizygus marmoreus TaxID=39966 RepID=A0A369K0R1_HYPMA|nr:hypothetical protein Hypma_007937 [Hypsizygus marmoreus]